MLDEASTAFIATSMRISLTYHLHCDVRCIAAVLFPGAIRAGSLTRQREPCPPLTSARPFGRHARIAPESVAYIGGRFGVAGRCKPSGAPAAEPRQYHPAAGVNRRDGVPSGGRTPSERTVEAESDAVSGLEFLRARHGVLLRQALLQQHCLFELLDPYPLN